MLLLRALFLRHRALALAVIAAALCLKALVPAGYMLATESTRITVQVCNDASGAAAPKQIGIPVKGTAGEHPDDPTGHKATPACPYSVLTLGLTGGTAPALLALALAFALLLGFAPVRLPPTGRASYLRPPLRAPPALV